MEDIADIINDGIFYGRAEFLVDDSIFDANVLILGFTSVGENFKPRESSSVWGVVSCVSVRLITVRLLSSGFIKGVVDFKVRRVNFL